MSGGPAAPRLICVTGASGGGKSSLIDELARRGFATVAEPGRRAIANGFAPWDDYAAFLDEIEQLARADLKSLVETTGPVFFDRGLLDALAAKERAGLGKLEDALGDCRPYARDIIFADVWPKIFKQDADRRHDLEAAQTEADHLALRLPQLSYRLHILPRLSVAERADWVVRAFDCRSDRNGAYSD